MKIRTTLTTYVICLILSTSCYAQGFTAGDRVFSLSGSGSSNEDMDDTSFSVEGSLGWFLNDIWEVDFRQGLGWMDVPGSNNDFVGSSRLALDYNFDEGNLWPFLGINGGYVYGDAIKDQWIAGPEGGLRWFVNSTTYILGLVEYQILFDDDDNKNDPFDDGRFVYTLGIGFKF